MHFGRGMKPKDRKRARGVNTPLSLCLLCWYDLLCDVLVYGTVTDKKLCAELHSMLVWVTYFYPLSL